MLAASASRTLRQRLSRRRCQCGGQKAAAPRGRSPQPLRPPTRRGTAACGAPSDPAGTARRSKSRGGRRRRGDSEALPHTTRSAAERLLRLRLCSGGGASATPSAGTHQSNTTPRRTRTAAAPFRRAAPPHSPHSAAAVANLQSSATAALDQCSAHGHGCGCEHRHGYGFGWGSAPSSPVVPRPHAASGKIRGLSLERNK